MNKQLFVVGSNYSLQGKRWQIKPRKMAINLGIRQQQGHGNSIQPTTAEELSLPSITSTEGRSLLPAAYAFSAHNPTPAPTPPNPPELSPQCVTGHSREMNVQQGSSGKRVSLVDNRGSSADVDMRPQRDYIARAAAASTAGVDSKKKKVRHISQLNSSENGSQITSAGTTAASTTSTDRSAAKRNGGGRGRRRSTSYGKNKTIHLFPKLIHRQRSILQIPRLNLLPRFH